MELPIEYTKKMQALLGDEFGAYLESFSQGRYYGLRANTLKITPDELKRKLSFGLKPIPWCKEGFYYNGDDVRPSKSPYYNAGLFYIQEPSAMSTGALLPVEKGDRVLDLCAAPGGKSTQAAAKTCGEGVIVSNDISASRCKALIKNIEVCGVKNCIITNESPERLADKLPHFFNKIIVDAPCSGEGMFRKDEDAVKSWETHKTDFCQGLQREILHHADRLLAKDGIIAYSTCTFAPEENEGMLDEFIKKHPYYSVLEIDKSLGLDRGRPEWSSADKQFENAGRLWPHKVHGEGHFICLLQKTEGEPMLESYEREDEANKKDLGDFYDFAKAYLNIDLSDKHLLAHNGKLLAVPLGLGLKGLRVMRSGIYLGDLKTKRFEPSQAFAMALKKEDAKLAVDFALDSPELMRYMRGESFNVDCSDGWALVCADGYPLGWGKVQKGRLKNKYLSSWMM
ncbi:MAG: RsmB/NOP family class I SAM-dependent RNA methyltransferase [Firmicutes bacterium]|nr:RsmB/NOP family class I SAM-dependent RNA methyltransferase [Bacillota bacterium]